MGSARQVQVTRVRDALNRETRFTLVVPDEALLEDVPMALIDKLRSAWKEAVAATTGEEQS